MNEKESKLAKLYAELEGGSATNADDAKAGREKAAKQWVQHFVAVKKLIDELKVDGKSPKTIDELVAELAYSWGSKAEESDKLIAGLF